MALRRFRSPILTYMETPLADPFWTAPLRGWAGPKASVEEAIKAAKARELTIFILMVYITKVEKECERTIRNQRGLMGRVSAFYRTVSERQASTREVSDDDVFLENSKSQNERWQTD